MAPAPMDSAGQGKRAAGGEQIRVACAVDLGEIDIAGQRNGRVGGKGQGAVVDHDIAGLVPDRVGANGQKAQAGVGAAKHDGAGGDCLHAGRDVDGAYSVLTYQNLAAEVEERGVDFKHSGRNEAGLECAVAGDTQRDRIRPAYAQVERDSDEVHGAAAAGTHIEFGNDHIAGGIRHAAGATLGADLEQAGGINIRGAARHCAGAAFYADGNDRTCTAEQRSAVKLEQPLLRHAASQAVPHGERAGSQ